MPTLSQRFNWGSEIRNINQVLYNQLNDSYTNIARIMNTKASKNVTTTNPEADAQVNMNYDIGDLWINQSANSAYIMTSRTSSTAVTWTLIT